MKSFGQLNYEQRVAAVSFATDLLVKHVVEGVIELQMPNSIMQSQLDKLLSDTRKSEQPQLAIDFILKNPAMRKVVDKIAIAAAEGSHYTESGEVLIQTQRSLQ